MIIKKRLIFDKVIKQIKNHKILVITGPRQIGKTTLLKYIQDKYPNSFYITLENPDYLSRLNQHPDEIFNIIGDKKGILLIDEIQYLNNPSNFLKYIYDEYRKDIKLVVTGSSAFYIDRKFKDSLIGRKIIFNLYPLNFTEYLIFNDEPKLFDSINNGQIPLLYKNKMQKYLYEYISYGSYPEVTITKDIKTKELLLNQMALDISKKESIEAGIQNSDKFYKLLMLLAEKPGNLLNLNELASTLGISQPTVDNYIYILQKAFIINLVRPFSNNKRSELSKMPKEYFIDTGIRNAFLKNYDLIINRIDRGNLFENTVYKELFLKYQDSSINYWRTQSKNEVDFIIDGKFAYEAKLDKKLIKIKKYKSWQSYYPEINLDFITQEDLLEKIYYK